MTPKLSILEQVSYHTVSVGQEIQCGFAGGSGSASFMKLYSRYWWGLQTSVGFGWMEFSYPR